MHDDTLVVGAMKFNAVQIVKYDGWVGVVGSVGFWVKWHSKGSAQVLKDHLACSSWSKSTVNVHFWAFVFHLGGSWRLFTFLSFLLLL